MSTSTITDLLKSWNLEGLIDVFNEHCIDLDSIQLLEEETLKEIVPQLGLRLRLLSKLAAYKKTVIFLENVETATFSPLEVSASTSRSSTVESNSDTVDVDSEFGTQPLKLTVDSFINNPEPPQKKIRLTNKHSCALKSVLEANPKGKYVLAYYQKHGIFNRDTRQKLVDIIVENELKDNLTRSLKSEDLDRLALTIEQTFPTESKECYFTLVNVKGKRSGRGKLFTKYYNLRRRFRKVGLLKETAGTTETDVVDKEYSGPELEDKIKWLENSVSPWAVVIEYWEQTYILRRCLLENHDIEMYLRKFPVLTTENGYELLEKDFCRMYEGKELCLFTEWEKICNKVLQLFVKSDKRLQDKIKDISTEQTSDIKALKFFLLLPHILPTITVTKNKEGQWRPSRQEVEEAFILHISELGQLNGALESRQQKLLKFKSTLQPFIFIVGANLDNITDVYVRVNHHQYKLPSVVKAVDICFKFFFALNATYPIECEQVWLLVQHLFYGIKTKSDKKFISVNSLVNDLNNI